MGNIHIAGIITSMVLMGFFIYLGVIARKQVTSVEGYFSAGRSIGAFVNGFALTSSYLSLAAFLGYTAMVWGIQGQLAILTQAWMAGFALMVPLLVGPLRTLEQYTIAGYLNKRFQCTNTKIAAVVIMSFVMTMYSVGQMKGLANLFEMLFGISFLPALVLAGIIVISYITFGGMYGVSWTQAAQGVILVIAMIIPVMAILKAVGATAWFIPWYGYGNMVPSMMQVFPDFFSKMFPPAVSTKWYVSVFFSMILASLSLPHFINRVASSKSVIESRKAFVIGLFFIGSVNMLTYAAGFSGLLHTLQQNTEIATVQADKLLLIMSQTFMGDLGFAIVIAGALSAGISTIAGGLMVIGTGIAHDIIGNVKDMTDEQRRKLAPIAVAVSGVAVVLITSNPPQFILSSVMWAIIISGSAFCAVLIMGIWWKGANKYGALSSMIVGAVLSIVFNASWAHPSLAWSPILSKAPFGPIPYGGIFAIPASFIVLIVVSLITNKMPNLNKEITDDVVEKMHGWPENTRKNSLRYSSNTGPIIILIISIVILIYALI